MDKSIKQRLAKLQEDYQHRGHEVIDELRDEDPDTYAMVMFEALGQMDDEGELEEEVEEPAQEEQRTLIVNGYEGETEERALARSMVSPEFLALSSIDSLTSLGNGPTDLNELSKELEAQTKKFKEGNSGRAESMLSAQSHTLDAMFHNLIGRAMVNIKGGYSEVGRDYLKLAMKAQSQCRTTLDSLTAINRPIIKQTNIAHGPQQVNIHPNQIPPNKLLGEKPHVDGGTKEKASDTDTHLAAVERIDWPKVTPWKRHCG